MDIRERTVVVSTAGHDKGVVFAVIGFTLEKYALIADGTVRKLEKPKKKKLKHLEPIGILEKEIPAQTNRQLKKAVKSFDAWGSQGR